VVEVGGFVVLFVVVLVAEFVEEVSEPTEVPETEEQLAGLDTSLELAVELYTVGIVANTVVVLG